MRDQVAFVYLSLNGSAGLTATRTVLDGGATERTVTIKNGLITAWTS